MRYLIKRPDLRPHWRLEKPPFVSISNTLDIRQMPGRKLAMLEKVMK
jgi:hypothetical protein